MRSVVERRTTEPDRRRVTGAGPMAHPPRIGAWPVFATPRSVVRSGAFERTSSVRRASRSHRTRRGSEPLPSTLAVVRGRGYTGQGHRCLAPHEAPEARPHLGIRSARQPCTSLEPLRGPPRTALAETPHSVHGAARAIPYVQHPGWIGSLRAPRHATRVTAKLPTDAGRCAAATASPGEQPENNVVVSGWMA